MDIPWASPREPSRGCSARSLPRSSGWRVESGRPSESPREELPDTRATGHPEPDGIARRPVQRQSQEWTATAFKGDPFGDLSEEHRVRGQANGAAGVASRVEKTPAPGPT